MALQYSNKIIQVERKQKTRRKIELDRVSHPLRRCHADALRRSTHLLGVVPLVLSLGGSVDGVSYRSVGIFRLFESRRRGGAGVK